MSAANTTVDEERLFRELSSLSSALDRDISNVEDKLFQALIASDEVDTPRADSPYPHTGTNMTPDPGDRAYVATDSNCDSFDEGQPFNSDDFICSRKGSKTISNDEDMSRDPFDGDLSESRGSNCVSDEAVNEKALQWTMRLDKLILNLANDSDGYADKSSVVSAADSTLNGDVLDHRLGGHGDFKDEGKGCDNVKLDSLMTGQNNVVDVVVEQSRQLEPIESTSLTTYFMAPAVEYKTGRTFAP